MHVLEFRLRRYFPNCWRPKRRLSRGDYAAAAAEAGGRVRLGIPLAEEGWPKGEGSLCASEMGRAGRARRARSGSAQLPGAYARAGISCGGGGAERAELRGQVPAAAGAAPLRCLRGDSFTAATAG